MKCNQLTGHNQKEQPCSLIIIYFILFVVTWYTLDVIDRGYLLVYTYKPFRIWSQIQINSLGSWLKSGPGLGLGSLELSVIMKISTTGRAGWFSMSSAASCMIMSSKCSFFKHLLSTYLSWMDLC